MTEILSLIEQSAVLANLKPEELVTPAELAKRMSIPTAPLSEAALIRCLQGMVDSGMLIVMEDPAGQHLIDDHFVQPGCKISLNEHSTVQPTTSVIVFQIPDASASPSTP